MWPIQPPDHVDAVDYIAQTRDSYAQLGYDAYRWAEHPDAPALNAPVELAGARVGLVASGGIYQIGQVAFHHADDTGHRLIPADVDVADLRISHFAYDTTDAKADPNVVFPIDALRTLEAEGVIGELAPRAVTFMGGIYSQRRVREELIPAVEAEMREMEVDVVLLVPV